MSATVVQPGLLTTVQDLGRPGFRNSGVTPGGALDPVGLRVANLLVGNDESAAGIEITLAGPRLRFADERVVAWCGGSFGVRVEGTRVPAGRAFVVRANEELRFERAETGCRAWLAVSGGIEVPMVLGSRSTDLRGGFGGFKGRALRAGDVLPFGPAAPRPAALRNARSVAYGAPAVWASLSPTTATLRVVRGADWRRFDPRTHVAILGEDFTVTPESNRMGARLAGPPLQRNDGGADLISEAVAPGTLQVPPGGQPILLLADCQTIGGYPKLAHMITVDLPLAAQLRPGDRVRFCEVSHAEATRLIVERERALARFRVGIRLHT